jgi:hypothetical protein
VNGERKLAENGANLIEVDRQVRALSPPKAEKERKKGEKIARSMRSTVDV